MTTPTYKGHAKDCDWLIKGGKPQCTCGMTTPTNLGKVLNTMLEREGMTAPTPRTIPSELLLLIGQPLMGPAIKKAVAVWGELERDLAAREAELAEVKAERVDWARRFLLDGHTPAQWKQRAEAAELAEKDAEYRVRARVLDLGAAMGRVERAEAERDEWKRKAEESARFRAFIEWCDLYMVEITTVADERGSYRLDWYRGQCFANTITGLIDAVNVAIAAKGEA